MMALTQSAKKQAYCQADSSSFYSYCSSLIIAED